MRVLNETQRFNQWWLQCLNIGLVVFLGYCCYKWFIVKEAVDKVVEGNSTGQLIVIASVVPVVLFLYLLKLNTLINEAGIHYQFFPFHLSKRTIRWNEIQNCYVRTYSPIREYGGWGYRISMGKNGKAFNVKGNKGIQIKFKNGKRLLLGTQQAKNAQEVVERYFKTRNE